MLFWLVILGVYMGWVEQVYAKPERESPDESLPEIPEFYRRRPIPVLEPDDTPLLADAYLRAGGGG